MMTKHMRLLLTLLAACCMVLAAGCDDDDTTNTPTDTVGGDTTTGDTDETDTTETDTTETDTAEDTTEGDADTTEGDADTAEDVDMADTTGDPECEAYCDLLATNCTGANAQYTDESECLTTCAGFDRSGMEGDTGGDTLQCRTYHGGDPSALDPAFHCAHAGPDGGGVCVAEPPSPCARFCANVLEYCTDEYAVYADMNECTAACNGFATDGMFGDSSGNTLQCRDRYAQTSVDDPVLCLATAEDGGGLCVDDDEALQLDRMGRPAINTALISSAHKQLYNAASPDQASFFVAEMTTFLQAIDDLDGNDTNGAGPALGIGHAGLAGLLADDVLIVKIDEDDCTGGYLALETGVADNCGGRTLGEDVIDKTLQVLVDLSATTVVSDDVDANDVMFTGEYPYLADPNAGM